MEKVHEVFFFNNKQVDCENKSGWIISITKDNSMYVTIEMFGNDSAMEISLKSMTKISSDDFPIHLVDINIMLRREHKMQHDHRI